MRYLIILFLLVNFLFSSETAGKVEFGLLHKNIFITKRYAEIAKKVWIKHTEDHKLTKHTYINLYEDEDEIINSYLNNKNMGLILINPSLYYEHKTLLDKNSFAKWVPIVNKDSMFEQYFIIKNKESEVDFNSLKNMKIMYIDNISKVWFEYYLMKKYKRNVSSIISKMKGTKNSSKLFFDSFFLKDMISIVPKSIYDDMIEMNPQVKIEMEILDKSEEIFIKAIGLSSNNLSKSMHEMLIETSDNINRKGNAFKIFKFLDLHKVIMLKEDEIADLDEFFKEYYILKKRYNSF